MSTELTWKEAINNILESSPNPLHCTEIAERIIQDGLRKNFGATPSATVGAQISASIKHEGDSSPFIRISKGIFTMRSGGLGPDPDPEEENDIVTSFGMFWRRDAVEWTAKPKLFGMQGIKATPVDFCGQLGIYLLYDGREVIYVGRSTDRPLGRRLYEHTLDRLSTRWNRFSWFGLLPVSNTGELGSLPKTHDASRLIPALEAILIEALEPRQNRKRGDDLKSVEYIQRVDPEIEKKKIRESLDKL